MRSGSPARWLSTVSSASASASRSAAVVRSVDELRRSLRVRHRQARPMGARARRDATESERSNGAPPTAPRRGARALMPSNPGRRTSRTQSAGAAAAGDGVRRRAEHPPPAGRGPRCRVVSASRRDGRQKPAPEQSGLGELYQQPDDDDGDGGRWWTTRGGIGGMCWRASAPRPHAAGAPSLRSLPAASQQWTRARWMIWRRVSASSARARARRSSAEAVRTQSQALE